MFLRLVCLVACGIAAATVVAADAVKIELKDFKLKADVKGADDLVKFDEGEGKIGFYCNATATADVKIAEDGEYTIAIEASCDEAQKVKATFTLKVGEQVVKENFLLTSTESKEYKFDVKLKKGETKLSISFTNDVYKESEYDRNLYVHAVKVTKK